MVVPEDRAKWENGKRMLVNGVADNLPLKELTVFAGDAHPNTAKAQCRYALEKMWTYSTEPLRQIYPLQELLRRNP
jgi:hypothetical protein